MNDKVPQYSFTFLPSRVYALEEQISKLGSIEDITEELNTLKTTVQNQEEMISTLQTTVQTQATTISGQQTEINDLKQRVTALETPTP